MILFIKCGIDSQAPFLHTSVDSKSFNITMGKKNRKNIPREFSCKLCGYVTNIRMQMLNHMIEHSRLFHNECKKHDISDHSSSPKKGDYICEVCFSSHENKRQLYKHVLKWHGIDAEEEDEEFLVQPTFVTRTGKRKYLHICYRCGAVFKLRSQLLHHCRLMHERRDRFTVVVPSGKTLEYYKCDICSRQFENIRYLNTHKMNAHRTYSCSICGCTARNLYYLKKHKMDEHSPPYTCQHCDKSFENNPALKKHISESHGEPFVCGVCGLQFNTKVLLFEHRVTQHPSDDDKRHYCSVCNQPFLLRRYLATHMAKEHKQNNSIVCDTCGKCFNSASHLERHMISHSDERTILCSQCPATFKMMNSLKRHQRVVHEKKKDYKCDECSDAFGTNNILMQHKVYVHKMVTPYQCRICNKYYPCASHLENHSKKHAPPASQPPIQSTTSSPVPPTPPHVLQDNSGHAPLSFLPFSPLHLLSHTSIPNPLPHSLHPNNKARGTSSIT